MVNEKQKLEMLQKLLKIIKATDNCKSIGEVSKSTGIPRSTVQRFLNREDLFEELKFEGYTDSYQKKLFIKCQLWLEESKNRGLSLGGQVSQSKYDYSRDENGHFTGRKK